MPLSKVDENMCRAHKRDSVLTQKFWIRTNILVKDKPEVHELSIKDIMHGCTNPSFPGILPLVDKFITENATPEQAVALRNYVSVVGKRADGSLKTNARWMRDFVAAHPEYKKDSIVSQPVFFDMIQTIVKMNTGDVKYPW